ncbi:hypothetical protein Tco_0984070 [Tanacetum coccineum]
MKASSELGKDLRSTETSDRLAAIQAQLNNLRREITKVNEKVYAAQHSTLFTSTLDDLCRSALHMDGYRAPSLLSNFSEF